MSWRLFSTAIVLGILAGLVTIFVLASRFEPAVWVVLVALLGALTSGAPRSASFLSGIFAGAWITAVHLTFLSDYMTSHAIETSRLIPHLIAGSMRLTLLAVAPLYWLALGGCTLIAAIAAKRIRRR